MSWHGDGDDRRLFVVWSAAPGARIILSPAAVEYLHARLTAALLELEGSTG